MRELFPYSEVRKVQDEMIKAVEKGFLEGKNLLIHAPTGLGKTASTLPMALSLALEKGLTVFFLTNRHTQHQIAIETLKEVKEKHRVNFLAVDMIGKKWMCSHPNVDKLYSGEFNEFCKVMREGGKCEFYEKMRKKNKPSKKAEKLISEMTVRGPLSVEEMKESCQRNELCAYYMAVEMAKEAQVVIADYYYLFNPSVQKNFFARLGKDLGEIVLIVDEGHNLPDRIRDLMTHRLSNQMIRRAIQEAKKNGFGEIVGKLSGLQDVLIRLNLDDIPEVLVSKEKFVKAVGEDMYEELAEELQSVGDEIRKKQKKSFVGGVGNFLEMWLGEDEGFCRFVSEKDFKGGTHISLEYSCLDPSLITKDIFEKVHSSVLMSGTLIPTSMFRDILGMEKAVEKIYSSPFPKENKLSLVVPEVSTKYTLRTEMMFKKIAYICTGIANLIPGNSAFFFPSYDLRDKVYRLFGDCGKKIFLEKSNMNKEEKTKMLQDFKRCKSEGAVLLAVAAANFAEGIDLPGDYLKGVAIVGLPLAKPDLKMRELIKYYDKKFGNGWNYGYVFPAINKCLQSAGRCIRSERDKGVIVFLDQRFMWKNYADCFPVDWQVKVTSDFTKELKQFYGLF